jgi:hypothetical protein
MKLNKAAFLILCTSLLGGFCLAYSVICHWFGFLAESKINRLEMLVVFGAVFIFLSWQLVKYAFGILPGRISRARLYWLIGAAVAAAGAVGLLVLPATQNRLIAAQMPAGAALTSALRLLWVALKLSDFASLAGLFLIGEVTFSILAGRWKLILPVMRGGLAVFFPVGLLLLVGVLSNLAISATSQLGALNKLSPLPANDLIALDEGSNTFSENIRVYAVFFENYPGWTLVTPAALLDKLDVDAGGRLKSWGRIKTIFTFDYPAALSDREMKNLLAYKNVNVENGSGLHYIAILEKDASRKVCFRTYQGSVFVVPVSLSPVCESK